MDYRASKRPILGAFNLNKIHKISVRQILGNIKEKKLYGNKMGSYLKSVMQVTCI